MIPILSTSIDPSLQLSTGCSGPQGYFLATIVPLAATTPGKSILLEGSLHGLPKVLESVVPFFFRVVCSLRVDWMSELVFWPTALAVCALA